MNQIWLTEFHTPEMQKQKEEEKNHKNSLGRFGKDNLFKNEDVRKYKYVHKI